MLQNPLFKKILFLPPLLLGLGVLAWTVANRKSPERAEVGEKSTFVRMLKVPRVDYVPRALGYGTVEPEKTWTAAAEVSGKIIEIHPDLRRGKILREGTVILRIDPTDYELAVAREKANLADASAEWVNLEVQGENARELLRIEEDALEVTRRQLEREASLLDRGAIPETQYEQTQKTVLAQRNRVQSLANTLNLIPSQREKIEAQREVIRSRLRQAERDIENTSVIVPFDCRVSDNPVEVGQAVVIGQTLARADGIAVSEVSAQVPIDRVRSVIRIPGRSPEPIGAELFEAMNRFAIGVLVRFRSGDFEVDWAGRFSRVSEQVDPKTRTVGVVVAVDDPYLSAIPGVRPPLVKGMYCEVEIRGATRPETMVIPRSSIRDHSIFLMNSENRLERREIEIESHQSDFVVVRSGLEGGEKLILTDLVPAIEGMLLNAVEDEESLDRLIRQARGESPVR